MNRVIHHDTDGNASDHQAVDVQRNMQQPHNSHGGENRRVVTRVIFPAQGRAVGKLIFLNEVLEPKICLTRGYRKPHLDYHYEQREKVVGQ